MKQWQNSTKLQPKKANRPEKSKANNTINYDTIFVINIYELQELINLNCQKNWKIETQKNFRRSCNIESN